jgi:hypothetical protein
VSADAGWTGMSQTAAIRATASTPSLPSAPSVPPKSLAPLAAWGRRSEAPAIACGLALLATFLGWHGTDLAAQVYRVSLFNHHGLTVWDNQWYGGQWTLSYSVIFPPVAALLGVEAVGVISATVAAFSFDRLAIDHFGPAARIGSLLFALGTVAQVAIGQLPFLMGEALGLTAFLMATKRRWPAAVVLAAATSLASPLAGCFLALAALAWLVSAPRDSRIGIATMLVGAATPLAVTTVLFPGQGFFPYPFPSFAFEVAVCLGLWIAIPRNQVVLRTALGLYALAAVASFLLPTPMGGNVGRLGACMSLPIAACALWPQRRRVLALAVVPLALWQWMPAWGAMVNDGLDPSTHKAYFQPLLVFLAAHDQPAGRVEVVPTHLHWEAAYVAPTVALARGWDRQLDTAGNPIFYEHGSLSTQSYHSWLIDNGVRFVALPDTSLDYAAVAEAQLVRAGVPGLRPVWRNAHWRVFAVDGSSGIVDGPARLISLEGTSMVLDAASAGTILVRVRYNAGWTVSSGAACVEDNSGRWTTVKAEDAGLVQLKLHVGQDPDTPC